MPASDAAQERVGMDLDCFVIDGQHFGGTNAGAGKTVVAPVAVDGDLTRFTLLAVNDRHDRTFLSHHLWFRQAHAG
jgi:hypothetical protein